MLLKTKSVLEKIHILVLMSPSKENVNWAKGVLSYQAQLLDQKALVTHVTNKKIGKALPIWVGFVAVMMFQSAQIQPLIEEQLMIP